MLPRRRATHLAVLAWMLVPVPGQAVTLEGADGLRLEVAENGGVTAVAVGDAQLPLKGEGGFSVADFKDQPEPANLVPNLGFEEGTRGWALATTQSLDTTVAHNGAASARLAIEGPVPGKSSLEVQVPARPNSRYRVGMWVRREQVGVCGAYVSERDDQNRLTGKRTQVGVPIPKVDGRWLPLSWEIVTEPATTVLSLRADIYNSTGTLWLDDFFIHEITEGVYRPVRGTLESDDGASVLRSSLPDMGLGLEATFTSDKGCLRVDGVVRDTTGDDRAVGVRFSLPLDIPGWTWWTDAEERQSIEPGPIYRHTYNCRTGVGRCSIYPWAALSGPEAGLSVALPLSQGPRVFILQHDQGRAETSLTFFFGLTQDSDVNPSSAPFSFVIYSHDPAWGMRSAMQRYYAMFPESFVKRPVYEGYLNYANLERFDPATHDLVIYNKTRRPDASDFGEGYKFIWRLHGCYDFRQVPYDDPAMPSDEKVLELLGEMAEWEKERPRSYSQTVETMKRLTHGPDGQILYIGDTKYWRAREGYNRTDEPGWGLNFRVNEDPDVSPALAELSRRKIEAYAQDPDRQPWDATVTADAIEGYVANRGGPNFRREHFKTTRVPLSFGKGNLKVCMPNGIWDFHVKAWRPQTEEHKVVTYGNANHYEQFFTMPFVDIPMTEGNWDPKNPGRLDRFMRAVNYRKIWRYWHAWDERGAYGDRDPANVEAQFRRGLAYAVYPAVSSIEAAAGSLEPHRASFRQHVPAIEELSVAGWDPVPFARATAGVIVERFGDFASGELHLTLRNYPDAEVTTTVSIGRAGLGIPAGAELVMTDILPRTPVVRPLPESEPEFELPADGVLAIWIGTREQAAQHGFRLAAAVLEKLERAFRTEMDDGSRAALDSALSAARQGATATADDCLALAERLQGELTGLQDALETEAPVDLAKLIQRARTATSFAPAALLGLTSNPDRVVRDAVRGATVATPWGISATGGVQAGNVQFDVLSPWPALSAQCRVEQDGGRAGDDAITLLAHLSFPEEPPRPLIPYLLRMRGNAGGEPFTLVTPVDVVSGKPVEISVLPERVFRGGERQLNLMVSNRIGVGGAVTLKFSPPPKVRIEPAETPIDLPATTSRCW